MTVYNDLIVLGNEKVNKIIEKKVIVPQRLRQK